MSKEKKQKLPEKISLYIKKKENEGVKVDYNKKVTGGKYEYKGEKFEYKQLPFSSIKVINKDEGIIEAYVSVFNVVDSMNEVVAPGAFKESLLKKLPKGVWSHNWDKPVAITLEAREDAKGLYIKGQFNLETQRGKEAFSDVKFGIMDEFSIGYQVDQYSEDNETAIRTLEKLTLYEWSPVLVGANRDTELLSVKSKNGKEKKEVEKKSPACRLEEETEKECIARKIPEILKENPDMERDQAVAIASDMCKEKCDGKGKKELPPIENPAPALKEGRVLSEKNRTVVKNAIDALQKVYDASEPPEKIQNNQKQNLNVPDKKGKEVEPEPEKILRIRQVAKQMDKGAEFLLRITKTKN